jgi:hypothetical protein
MKPAIIRTVLAIAASREWLI